MQVLVDGSFPSRALVASGYITAIDAQFSAKRARRVPRAKGAGPRRASCPCRSTAASGSIRRSKRRTRSCPGLLVISLMFYPSLLAALVVVREKERGTIFNLYCSPVSRWEVIVGKAVPYIGLAFFVYFLLFALSVLRVPRAIRRQLPRADRRRAALHHRLHRVRPGDLRVLHARRWRRCWSPSSRS